MEKQGLISQIMRYIIFIDHIGPPFPSYSISLSSKCAWPIRAQAYLMVDEPSSKRFRTYLPRNKNPFLFLYPPPPPTSKKNTNRKYLPHIYLRSIRPLDSNSNISVFPQTQTPPPTLSANAM